MNVRALLLFVALTMCCASLNGEDAPAKAAKAPARSYANRLTLLRDPGPLLADHPEFIQPIEEVRRFSAPRLIDEAGADLEVRAWRFSYNARGVIEIPNSLLASKTAVVVVHPWGVDDGQGWRTPQPAGAAFACTLEKNQIYLRHGAKVINPLLKRLRGRVAAVVYSLPGKPDPIRTKLYRTMDGDPDAAKRKRAAAELKTMLASFDYRGRELPKQITLGSGLAAVDYFRQFPGLTAGEDFNNRGFWELPIPVMNTIDVHRRDVVAFDTQGYERLKAFLRKQGVRHVLLAGYSTDMCVCSTMAGYENLRRDFNVFLVGDATLATFPANKTPAHATNQAVSYAALNLFITQASWIK